MCFYKMGLDLIHLITNSPFINLTDGGEELKHYKKFLCFYFFIFYFIYCPGVLKFQEVEFTLPFLVQDQKVLSTLYGISRVTGRYKSTKTCLEI